jgi:hypothetical protein
MLQDYPLYEEMVRRGSRGRWFWRIGSWLFYISVIGICLLLAVWPVVLFFSISDFGLMFFVALVLLAGLFTLGSFLKKVSYKIALGEGIDIAAYLAGGDDAKK